MCLSGTRAVQVTGTEPHEGPEQSCGPAWLEQDEPRESSEQRV